MVADDISSAPADTGEDTGRSPALHISLSEIAFQGRSILENLQLSLESGKTTCLLGPSGVGKTSILKSIAGFLPLAEGSLIEASDHENLSGRIAYMDQNDLLLPWATVLDNVLIAARLSGQKPDSDKALDLLEKVGLIEKAASRPDQLSGGMRQRAALARTLMSDCPFVLVDEPFSALDAITRHRLQALMVDLMRDRTVLMITHDPLEALRIGHQIYVLSGDPVILSPPLHVKGAPPRIPTDEALQPRLQLILSMLGMTREDA